MKSISIKVPLSIAQSMDDRGQLNPQWLTQFISTFELEELSFQPIKEFTFNYKIKINEKMHKRLKLKAIDQDIALNEYLGRLLVQFYHY